MKPTLVRLLGLPRRTKQLVLLLADLLCLPAFFWAALALRYDTMEPAVLPGVPFGLALMAVGPVLMFALTGVYRAVVRAFDETFLQDLLLSVVVVVGVLFALASLRVLPMPRSVPFIYGFFTFLWVWASRSAIRRLVRFMVRVDAPLTRVAIYGAGAAGRQILAALRSTSDYYPVAFFDDASELVGTRVQGLQVFRGADFGRVHAMLAFDEVLIALPSVSRARRREVVERLEPYNIRIRTLPGFSQLVGGEVSISDIREVDITDLLGRDPVPPVEHLLSKDIAGRNVMVTGAGGSIGSELCRQVLAVRPRLLVLCDVSEFALYRIEQELRPLAGETQLIALLGSVTNEERMRSAMAEHRVDTVYHAAAYKHVPIVEHNPFEGIINNTFGTYHAARAAMSAGVSTFVLISTDKAVRPTNVMGASKRLAELVLQAFAAEAATQTRFCMVRFGNVLGSSGSVVPLFREQIAKGGPITVTHPDVTRYFMTIPEAAQLVIQAGAMGAGGDVFVLDMGESVKIVELARKMIRLSGMSVREPGQSDGDIEIVYTGLRPGEKLYEELLIGSEVSGTEHARIKRAMENRFSLARMQSILDLLEDLARDQDVVGLRALLAEVVEGYPKAPAPEMLPARATHAADAPSLLLEAQTV